MAFLFLKEALNLKMMAGCPCDHRHDPDSLEVNKGDLTLRYIQVLAYFILQNSLACVPIR